MLGAAHRCKDRKMNVAGIIMKIKIYINYIGYSMQTFMATLPKSQMQ